MKLKPTAALMATLMLAPADVEADEPKMANDGLTPCFQVPEEDLEDMGCVEIWREITVDRINPTTSWGQTSTPEENYVPCFQRACTDSELACETLLLSPDTFSSRERECMTQVDWTTLRPCLHEQGIQTVMDSTSEQVFSQCMEETQTQEVLGCFTDVEQDEESTLGLCRDEIIKREYLDKRK